MKSNLTSLILASSLLSISAADWTQWRGPNRDGHSTETGLLKSWPKDGPPLKWKITGMGGGYASPAVAAGRIFGAGYRGDQEVVWALNESEGKELWSTTLGPANREIDYCEGPNAMPAVDGDRVYILGAVGNLVCLETKSGKVLWKRDLAGDFGGKLMTEYGYAESPLIDGDRLICMPGGDKGTVAALNKATGELIWQSAELKDPAAYTSLIAAELGGQRQYVVLTGDSIAGVAASNGKLLWQTERRGRTGVVATPIIDGNRVWVSSGYGIGSHMYEVTASGGSFKVEEVYASRSLKNEHGGAIQVGKHVYAANGPTFVCMELATGDVAWKERSVGNGSLAFADGHLYLRSERGPIALIKASPEEIIEVSRFNQPDRTRKKSWAHPVIANGNLLIRDQDLLLCYDVRAK